MKMKSLLAIAMLALLFSCGGASEETEMTESEVTTETSDQVNQVQEVEDELMDLEAELDSLTQDL